MICPNCGANIPDGTSFCGICGTKCTSTPPVPNNGNFQNANNYSNPIIPPSGGIQNRSIGLYIVLSIITCGIFGYYWIYTITEDTNKLSGDPNATSGGMVILFSIITCGIYLWYWMYKRGEILDRAKTSRGLPSSNSGMLYIILTIFGLGIISYALIQSEINNFATA